MKLFVSLCVLCLSQVVFSQTTDEGVDSEQKNTGEANMLTRPIQIKSAVYTNPSTDFVYRPKMNEHEVFVEFINTKGEVVLSYPSDAKYDIRHLPNGIYYINGKDKDHNLLSTNKFVKN